MSKPTYSIQSFRFQNFKGIKDLEVNNLPEGAPWIFITGENGYGKTSVLQALASSITSGEGDIGKFARRGYCTNLNCKIYGSNHEYKIYTEFSIVYDKGSNLKFTKLACYGSSRLDTYAESSKKITDVTSTLFNTRTLLESIEDQLTRWYAKKDDDQEFKKKYENTKKLLTDLLQIKDIEIDYKTDEVFYIEEDALGETYEKRQLWELAAGYQNLVGMIGDMILRLFRTQANVHNPSELEGIVIIDEIELHLHPKWQKRLPGVLTKYFPKIQFIASTHSPIPLLGAPEGSVFLTLRKSKEAGITAERSIYLEQEISKLTPNLLLDSFLFARTDLSSVQLQEDERIETADTFNERNYRKNLEKQMKEELTAEERTELRKLLTAK